MSRGVETPAPLLDRFVVVIKRCHVVAIDIENLREFDSGIDVLGRLQLQFSCWFTAFTEMRGS